MPVFLVSLWKVTPLQKQVLDLLCHVLGVLSTVVGAVVPSVWSWVAPGVVLGQSWPLLSSARPKLLGVGGTFRQKVNK